MEFIHIPWRWFPIPFFFYSLRGALIKIARGCYTWWRNYFDGTTPLTAISTPWGRGWHVHQPTAWPVPNSCAKPNHPGVSIQLSRPRGLLIRDHQNMKFQQVHSDKPISMIQPNLVPRAFPSKNSRLTNEPWTLAPGIVSISRACLFYSKARNWRVVHYFHIWDRASIPGHARTIFCVHVSSRWVSALTFLMFWFHYSVEVLVTVRSNIYYLSHS